MLKIHINMLLRTYICITIINENVKKKFENSMNVYIAKVQSTLYKYL